MCRLPGERPRGFVHGAGRAVQADGGQPHDDLGGFLDRLAGPEVGGEVGRREPRAAQLNSIDGSASAYCTVSIDTAALVAP
jgi:hypothetical protein